MDNYLINNHINEFKEYGYTVLKGLNKHNVEFWRSTIESIYFSEGAGWFDRQRVGLSKKEPTSLLHRCSDIFLPYPISTDLLDVAEALMGPFVSLAGIGAKVSAPMDKRKALQFRVWHRDMWPVHGWTEDYLPPEGINVLTYLQEGEMYGKLKVIPGSHRGNVKIPDSIAQSPNEKELSIKLSQGDTVLIHSSLFHSESGNYSDELRILINCFLVKCWLPGKMNYEQIPAVKDLINYARETRNNRIIRLFSPDLEEVLNRVWNWHAHKPDGCSLSTEDMWGKWLEEDRKMLE